MQNTLRGHLLRDPQTRFAPSPDHFSDFPCFRGISRKSSISTQVLGVVFPLTEPRKPPGRKSPKNGAKLQNSSPRSNPRKWGKITEKLQKCIFGVFFVFSPFSGGGILQFFPIFRRFPPRGLPGLCKGKNNSQPKCPFQLSVTNDVNILGVCDMQKIGAVLALAACLSLMV